ncbi:MAG: hypothetical protein ACREA9_15855 [Pyrinomonadaceae bacterium]
MSSLLLSALLTLTSLFSCATTIGFEAGIDAATGQDDKAQSIDGGKRKTKIKYDRVVARDKSKPVRRALEERYAKIVEANRNKDLAAILSLRVPEFLVRMPNGDTWNFDQSANYSRAALQQVQSIISLTFEIGTITINGSEASAIIHQQWSRYQMKAGQLRRVDTTADQRETWINTSEGWKLKLIDDVRPGAWYVDGKRIDPTKPYDPDAPPFVPAVRSPEKE